MQRKEYRYDFNLITKQFLFQHANRSKTVVSLVKIMVEYKFDHLQLFTCDDALSDFS